jgi:hypothetical protein
MKGKALALMLSGLAISAPTFDTHAAEVQIRGTPSCGRWLNGKATTSWSRVTDESWLIGFLSGTGMEADKDFLKGTDNLSILLWVDNYCQTHPLSNVGEAGIELTNELRKKKRL